jgi:hypothetical protein
VLYDRGSEAVAQGPHPYRSTSFLFEKVMKRKEKKKKVREITVIMISGKFL